MDGNSLTEAPDRMTPEANTRGPSQIGHAPCDLGEQDPRTT
jgi:hypothetical protein